MKGTLQIVTAIRNGLTQSTFEYLKQFITTVLLRKLKIGILSNTFHTITVHEWSKTVYCPVFETIYINVMR